MQDAVSSHSDAVKRDFLGHLPAEVRSLIYDLLLLRRQPIDTEDENAVRLGERHIFSVCRFLYRETTNFYFKRNTFVFRSPQRGLAWLTTIGPHNARCLRRLRFPLQTSTKFFAFTGRLLLEMLPHMAPGLVALEITSRVNTAAVTNADTLRSAHLRALSDMYLRIEDVGFVARGLEKLPELRTVRLLGDWHGEWDREVERILAVLKEKRVKESIFGPDR